VKNSAAIQRITLQPQSFPSGIKSLADFISEAVWHFGRITIEKLDMCVADDVNETPQRTSRVN